MSTPFYENGLRFSCTRCSRCCRHQPGYVFLSERDLERLQARFGMVRDDFIDAYCRQVNINGLYRISLRERSNYDCVFWEKGQCTVYEDRPLQCQSYPFWPAHLDSKEDWDELEKECPGVNIGRIHSREAIDRWLSRRRNEPLIGSRSAQPAEHPGNS